MVQFSLQCSEYTKNFCDGLSSLQQNGEMVDVTLAADGHLVHVHRLVLSLASPYLKELLASASECKHPVVFLNKVSFVSLSSILEYIYTGQVVLTEEQLPDLLQAAKALRIKGLEDVDMDDPKDMSVLKPKIQLVDDEYTVQLKPRKGYQIGKYQSRAGLSEQETATPAAKITITSKNTSTLSDNEAMDTSDWLNDNDTSHHFNDQSETDNDYSVVKKRKHTEETEQSKAPVQYTVSNSGTLRIIVNRYIYYQKYASIRDKGVKRWSCINERRIKCPAMIVTNNGIIIKRSGVHNHEYHDKTILKKVQANLVFATPNCVDISNKKTDKSKADDQ